MGRNQVSNGTLTFIDNSKPLPVYPPADGFAFYIGGDTPHVWTLEEINALPYRYRLPIFVRSNPQQVNPIVDAGATLAALRHIGAPRGTLVALDFETAIDVTYVSAYCKIVTDGGYTVILYGSEDFVHRNDMPDGLYWGADWTRVNHITPGDAGTQWISLSAFDVSTFKLTLPLWDTTPHADHGKTGIMIPLDVTWQEGDRGNRVRAIQALAGAKRGHTLACDGIFGPETTALVRGVQQDAQLPITGKVDVDTWKALLLS
jgi:hypothetical protein